MVCDRPWGGNKFHRVDATSRKLTGAARLFEDGRVQVEVRAPVGSFESGNVNRDEHMKEVVQVDRWPLVQMKAIGSGIIAPAQLPATVRSMLHARVELHGVSQDIDVPTTITFETPARAHAVGTFTLSLDAFKIERPSLMFIKIDDAVRIDLDVVFIRS